MDRLSCSDGWSVRPKIRAFRRGRITVRPADPHTSAASQHPVGDTMEQPRRPFVKPFVAHAGLGIVAFARPR